MDQRWEALPCLQEGICVCQVMQVLLYGWQSWKNCSNLPPVAPAREAGPRRRRVQAFSPWTKTLPQGGFTPPEDFKYPGPHGTRSVSWGDWRMPSDAVAALWMEELESLH